MRPGAPPGRIVASGARCDAAVAPDVVERIVDAREVVERGEVGRALLTPAERLPELGGGAGAVERGDLRRDVEDVEGARLVQRQRGDQAREVVLEAGGAGQHGLQRDLARWIGLVA